MTDETALKFSAWPFAAVWYALQARREYGFWRSLAFSLSDLWRRSGYWIFLAPLYVATMAAIIFLALAVAVGVLVIGAALVLQAGGLI